MLDSRTKQTLESDIVYFREQQKKPTDPRIWWVPSTFQEVERAIKDSATTPDERELLKSWILEFSLLNDKITDEIAKKRLADLKKEISSSLTQLPAPVEDRSIRPATNNQQTNPSSKLSDGNKEMNEAAEKIVDLDMKGVESFLKFSNLIIDRFTGPDRITMQSIRASYLLSKIDRAGFQYRFTARWIELQASDTNRAQKANEISLAIDTLIKTGILSLEELKNGVIYTTPSFSSYVENSRLSDGTPNTWAKMQDYILFLTKKPATELTREERIILESQSALTKVKMPELIRSYQNLGQMGTVLARDPELAKQTQALVQTVQPGVSPWSKDTPPWKIQSGANTVAEKASDLVGKTAENIWDFTTGTLKAIGKAFDKSPIGGMVVAVLALFAGWKFLTGDWWVGKMKAPGWVLALVAAGGAAWVAMARDMGYDVGEEVGKVRDKAGKKLKKSTNSDNDSSDKDTDTNTNKVAPKKPEEKTETTGLSPSQKIAAENVEKNEEILTSLEGKTPALAQYINFIHKELSSVSLEKLVTNDTTSIFHPSPSLHADIKWKIGNLNPISLKKVLRAYLGADVKFATTGVSQPGKKEEERFTKKLSEKWLNIATYKKETSLTELISILYTNEAKKDYKEIKKKITSYIIEHDGKTLATDNLDLEVEEYDDDTFGLRVSIKDPKKLNSAVSKIEPMIIEFDKDGNLSDTEVQLKTNIPGALWAPVYSLKQEGSKIILTKK